MIKEKILVMLLLVISITFVQSCKKDDPVTVDKAALTAKITEAENLIATTEEGTANGQYAFGSQATLQAVIDLAKVVKGNENATQTEVDNSVTNLTAAITTYLGQEVSPIAEDALIGFWAFDAGTGTTAKDYSDNGFDGTFENEAGFGAGVPTWTTDRYGNEAKAIAFDLGAKITIPYNIKLNPQQMTVALWVNAAELRASNRFMGLQSWNGYKFQLQDANRPFFTAATLNTTPGVDDIIYDRDAGTPIDLDTWYHLAVTFGGGNMVFYINGVSIMTWDDTPGDLVTVTDHDLVFGVGSSKYAATTDNYDVDHIIPLDWGGYFHGSLDEIRMYNTVLSAAQIESIYNVEKP